MDEKELNRKVNVLLFKDFIYGLFTIASVFLMIVVVIAILRVSWYFAFVYKFI